MIEPEVLREAMWPTWIVVLVGSATIFAQAFVRLIFGFYVVVDRSNGIRIPWVQIGWMIFLWAFLFASYWPVVDILADPDWTFGEFLYMTAGALLLFAAAYALAPSATYAGADGESRYLETGPLFFGLFAAVLVWLVLYANVVKDGPIALGILGAVLIVATIALAISKSITFHRYVSVAIWVGAAIVVVLQVTDVIDGSLRSSELAPIQGGVIAIWLASFIISIFLLIMIAMGQYLDRRSGFRPYLVHAAWVFWLLVSLLLVWWRSPLLVTEGWDYHHFIFVSVAPLFVALAWIFLMPTATGGDAQEAKAQYFQKAPQAFTMLALAAAWAIVMNLWLIGSDTAIIASIGWAILLALFVGMTRSNDWRLHAGAAVFAWVLLIGELALELERGVPAL